MASDLNGNEQLNTPQKDTSANFRMTLPRKLILQCLKDAENYLTADDIFVTLYPEYPGIGLATIYRTLNLLEEHEMINKVNLGDGKARFAYLEEDDAVKNYHQMVCKRCFKVIKFDEFTDSELNCIHACQQRYSEQFKFKIESHIVQYYGLCEECQKIVSEES